MACVSPIDRVRAKQKGKPRSMSTHHGMVRQFSFSNTHARTLLPLRLKAFCNSIVSAAFRKLDAYERDTERKCDEEAYRSKKAGESRKAQIVDLSSQIINRSSAELLWNDGVARQVSNSSRFSRDKSVERSSNLSKSIRPSPINLQNKFNTAFLGHLLQRTVDLLKQNALRPVFNHLKQKPSTKTDRKQSEKQLKFKGKPITPFDVGRTVPRRSVCSLMQSPQREIELIEPSMHRAVERSKSKETPCLTNSHRWTYRSPTHSGRNPTSTKASLERVSIKLDGCLLKDRRMNNNSLRDKSSQKKVVLGARIKDLLPDENVGSNAKTIVNTARRAQTGRSNRENTIQAKQADPDKKRQQVPATNPPQRNSFLKSNKLAQYKQTNSAIVSKQIVLCEVACQPQERLSMPCGGIHTSSGSTQPFSLGQFTLDDSRLLSTIDSVQKLSYASSQYQSRRQSQAAPCFGSASGLMLESGEYLRRIL